jgi:hypothetical protein
MHQKAIGYQKKITTDRKVLSNTFRKIDLKLTFRKYTQKKVEKQYQKKLKIWLNYYVVVNTTLYRYKYLLFTHLFIQLIEILNN